MCPSNSDSFFFFISLNEARVLLEVYFLLVFPKNRRLTKVSVEITGLSACPLKYFIFRLKHKGLLDFKILDPKIPGHRELHREHYSTSKSVTSFPQRDGSIYLTKKSCDFLTRNKGEAASNALFPLPCHRLGSLEIRLQEGDWRQLMQGVY